MSKQEIAELAGYETYEQLARDFRTSCDAENERRKHVKGGFYDCLYEDGAVK